MPAICVDFFVYSTPAMLRPCQLIELLSSPKADDDPQVCVQTGGMLTRWPKSACQ